MTIKLYLSVINDGNIGGEYEYEGNLYDLIDAQRGDETLESIGADQPIEVRVNGRMVPFSEWPNTHINIDDDVRIEFIPNGGVVSLVGSILGGIFGMVFGFLMPSHRAPSQYQTPQGTRLEVANLKANQARLGSTVPEMFGKFKRFGDYINEPRRYFSNRTEQYLEFLVCLSVGRIHVEPEDYYIGNTPISTLGDDTSFQKHEPNEDLSGVSAAQCWHVSDEVGGTSSGTAGLILSTNEANRVNTNPSSYHFDTRTITRPSGSFPPGWGQGTLVTITYPRPYTVTTEQIGGVFQQGNVFEGFFGHTLPGFTHFGGWTAGVLADLGGGYKRVYFYRVDEQTQDTTYYGGEANGTRTYTFNPDAQWAIDSLSETVMTLQSSGGRFFESDVNVASQIAFSGGTVYGEWSDSFVATPSGATSNMFEVDLFLPEGLGFIQNDGSMSNRSVSIQIEYRDLITNSVYSAVRSYTGATRDQMGFTERFTLPSQSKIQVRMRRIGARSNSNQVLDTIHWYGLKSRLPNVNRYPNWTTLSVRVRTGGKMAMTSENKVAVIGTRVLPELQSDGSWSAPKPTRQVAAAMRYISESIGYDISELDTSEMLRLHNTYWGPRNETFDFVIDETTGKAALDDVLSAGMSELSIENGILRPVRDEPRTAWEQGYSPQNIIGTLDESFKQHRTDDTDGIVVEYISDVTWEPETVNCFIPGDVGGKTSQLKLNGVTDRTRAWRIGMRARWEQEYRRKSYSFRTELDGLNSRYLSYIPILNDLRDYGQSALVMSASYSTNGTLIKVGEPLDTEINEVYSVAIRDERGFMQGPYPVQQVIDKYTIVVDMPASKVPSVSLKQEQPNIFFGKPERLCYSALVKTITPQEGIHARIEAVNYDVRVYQSDNDFPPEQ